MALSSRDYRQRFKTIARFVSFDLPKRLKRSDKAKVTRYYNRIGRALSKGYVAVRGRNDGRIQKANAGHGIKGMPDLKVALVRAPGDGFKVTIGKGGEIRAENAESGVRKVTLACQFFDREEADNRDVEDEADRLRKSAKVALGHKPQRCAVAYWGGENAWASLDKLEDLLLIDTTTNSGSKIGGYPADGISFYWVKQSKRILQIQDQLREERAAKAARLAAKRRASDV